jgi:starch synthase
MNILFASAEVAPYAKVGGLGDVAGALPSALRRLGHDVRVVMPYYHVAKIPPESIQVLVTPFNVYLGNTTGYGRLLQTSLPDETPLYLLDFPKVFDREPLHDQHNGLYGYEDDTARFIIFSRGVMALAHHLHSVEGWNPDVLHANDWHTGLVPNYLKFNDAQGLADTISVYTIHNLAYQGKTEMLPALRLSELGYNTEEAYNLPHDQFNFMLRGIVYADIVTTVSPEYATEITTPEYGEGLEDVLSQCQEEHKLYGILNGIDTRLYDPSTDPQLIGGGYANYSLHNLDGKAHCKAALQAECKLEVNPDRPLLAMVTRLVKQKGIEALIATLPALLRLAEDAQIVILGSDEDLRYQAALRYVESQYRDQFHLFIGFFPELAQHIYAGCDMIIVPSLFEPCGLIQMIAMRYGSVPIVRKTGGLADTVREGENGFVFGEPIKANWLKRREGLEQAKPEVQDFVFGTYTNDHLLEAILRALRVYHEHPEEWKRIQQQGMQEDHSWDVAAQPYLNLYAEARKRQGLDARL